MRHGRLHLCCALGPLLCSALLLPTPCLCFLTRHAISRHAQRLASVASFGNEGPFFGKAACLTTSACPWLPAGAWPSPRHHYVSAFLPNSAQSPATHPPTFVPYQFCHLLSKSSLHSLQGKKKKKTNSYSSSRHIGIPSLPFHLPISLE